MSVQRVCRPNHTFRGFQGQIECGEISVGDEVSTLPSNEKAHIKSIHLTDKEVQYAEMGQPVTIQLDKEVDVSRGCVLEKNSQLASYRLFRASILWMDDSKLNAGSDYFIKLGTKMITGIVSDIKYKIDVNTGEHIKVNEINKNEIAVCDIYLSENIVLDKFANHRGLGEFILIDRVTNMTSACGIVREVKDTNTYLDNDNIVFKYNDLEARGDIFEEFYYNTDSYSIYKYKPSIKTYTVGDEINIKGESYEYPNSFDVLIFRDWVAIKVRDKKIDEVISIDEYKYGNVPLINGRGFAINANSKEDTIKVIEDYKVMTKNNEEEFLNKYVSFDKYRKVIFNKRRQDLR